MTSPKEALSLSFDLHVRLAILRLLHGAPKFQVNDSVIADVLPELGLAVSRDQVKGFIAWLEEQRLISVEAVGSVVIATLTQRGGDVATGVISHPGVKRPSP
jgi:hypothetical protein